MTSKESKESYVWIWLPGETEPKVAGLIEKVGQNYHFNYGQSYLKASNKISFSQHELPLQSGVIEPTLLPQKLVLGISSLKHF